MTSIELVLAAIDLVNEQIVDGPKIPRSADAMLLDETSEIDSLTLVNVVVAVEELVASKLGKTVTLVDEDTFSSDEQPLRSVRSLAELVDKKLNG